jgi:chromosome segregation ATPase
MAQYHFTDQLGQAVTGAKKAAAEAAEQLVALDEELAAERESHRAEVMRLVERAEDAERERDNNERDMERFRAELEAERANRQAEALTMAQRGETVGAMRAANELESLRARVAELEASRAAGLRWIAELESELSGEREITRRQHLRIVELERQLTELRRVAATAWDPELQMERIRTVLSRTT